ncbi:MAG: GNAT family acetyltransferase [Hyphomicrobiales bacterium]|nr:GNAT family acetyltransferase [Hyphomicrobiales bacterium]MCP4998513.1 GNAT family acetyltransferase [Hyphomicrobiales bacterium]
MRDVIMDTHNIREIEDNDLDQIVALWEAAGVARSWNDPLHDIRFCRASPSSTLLVLVDGARVKGTAMVGEDGHRGWVYYVAIDPVEQGQGLGRMIMTAAENWLEARGIWKLNLLVRGGNSKVQAFYDSIGYKDTETRCYQKALNPSDPAQA